MTRTSSLVAIAVCPALVAFLFASPASPQAPDPNAPSGVPSAAPGPGAPPPGQQPWVYPTAQPPTGQPAAPGVAPAPQAPGAPPPGYPPGPAPAQPAGPPPGAWVAPAAPPEKVTEPPPADDANDRAISLQEHNSIYGASGLLRTVAAGSGKAGTFRLHLLTNWFNTSSFLCDASHPCITPNQASTTDSDSATQFGANVGISVTPVDWLEAYATIRSISNSNTRGQPQLLQILGDTMIGAKAFMPTTIGKTFTFGGSFDFLFLNGAGSVGLDSGATSFRLKGLATADLREPNDGGVPLRMHLNLGYLFDNSAALVQDVESQRAASNDVRGPRITRVERFGLGINRVDQMLVGFGVEGMFSAVRPFIEWNVGVASNRQGYACDPVQAASVGDSCLHDANFSGMPSTLTLGLRAYPFLKGLEAIAAFDIGTSGTSSFVEELAPTPPWNLWLGLGFAYDAEEPPPPKAAVVERMVAPRTVRVRGIVHEKDKPDPIADAIIRFEGRDLTGLATGADGRFVSADLDPGSYTLSLRADGYLNGRCQVFVPAPGAPMPAGPPGAPGAPGAPAPGAPNPWAPPPPPGAAGQPPGPGAPVASTTGPIFVDIDCPLEAAPKTGTITGKAVDAETNAAVSGLSLRIVDAEGKEVGIAADAGGGFHIENLQAGVITTKAEADGYMLHVQTVDVRAREESKVTLLMNKRPKRGDVEIAGNELKLKKQIHFDIDAATISLDSTALLEEIADTLNRNPCLKRIEIQGHTDNSGSKEHNKVLSDQRANAVREWLLTHGVESGRLLAQGYGQDRPISPNITPAGKERNRRVQFIIQDQDKNCGKGGPPAAPQPQGAPPPAAPAPPRAAPAPPPPPPPAPKPPMPF